MDLLFLEIQICRMVNPHPPPVYGMLPLCRGTAEMGHSAGLTDPELGLEKGLHNMLGFGHSKFALPQVFPRWGLPASQRNNMPYSPAKRFPFGFSFLKDILPVIPQHLFCPSINCISSLCPQKRIRPASMQLRSRKRIFML